MINVLLTGCDGQLGSEIKGLSSSFEEFNFFFTNKSKLDITDINAVKNFVLLNEIKIIINCAAYTMVEKAQFESELAKMVNHYAVANLAEVSKKNNIKLVHISTDYVFDGTKTKPYTEICQTNPLSIYGQTKLDGELSIIKINPSNSLIIRTSWLYSNFGNNFVKKIIALSKINNDIRVVNDQFGSPTYAYDLAKTILTILPKINNKFVEIYHYSNSGFCSWFDFAKEILALKKIKTSIIPVKYSDFQYSVNRPVFSALENNKIKSSFDIKIPFWKDSLRNLLKNRNLN